LPHGFWLSHAAALEVGGAAAAGAGAAGAELSTSHWAYHSFMETHLYPLWQHFSPEKLFLIDYIIY